MDNTTINDVTLFPGAIASLPAILIADDDPDDLFFAMHLVKRTGTRHRVTVFDDGLSVVDYLSRAWLQSAQGQWPLPRLLFLDLKMAGLGGFEFLEWISAHSELSAIHVVVLSGSNNPKDIARAKALGAKRYLAKFPGVATFARIIAHVYGASAVAPDSFRNGPSANELSEESVIENGAGQGSTRP